MKRAAPEGVNVHAADFLHDPFAGYQSLHAAGAAVWDSRLSLWLVPGHAAARAALRDVEALPSVTVGENLRRLGERAGRNFSELAGLFDMVPLLVNAPRHPPLRRYFAAIFAAKPVSSYVPAMREITAGLVAQARASGGFDAALDFADRLPPRFMARLLGLPESDLPALLEATNGLLVAFNRTLHVREYAALEPRAAAALALFRAVAAERRKTPRDDGISRMIGLRFEERAVSDEDVARFALVMFIVGVETTTTLIGSMIRLLLGNPASAAALRADRSLLKGAIEEALRCESPVQNAGRFVARALQIDGQRIAVGERMLVLIAAANRDPAVYPDPDRFDIRRRPAEPHIAFGDGPHTCLGATLARTETQVAIEAFLELPPMRSPGAQGWWPYDWLRRLKRLPVEFA